MRHLFFLVLLSTCTPAYAGWPNQLDPYFCGIDKADARDWGFSIALWQWLFGSCEDAIRNDAGTDDLGTINL
jgi:hypothetical protein